MPAASTVNSGLTVAFLTHRLSRQGGGLQSAMHGLSGALNDRRHNTAAVGIDDDTLDMDVSNWNQTAVHNNRLEGPTVFGYAPGMRQSLTEINPDVLHQHGLWTYASIVGRQWGGAHRVPRVISPHNMLDPVSMSIGRARKQVALTLYESRNLNTAGCIHSLVEREGKDIKALGYKPPICVIPNGISVAQAKPLSGKFAQFVDGSPYLLYLSRLTEVKQVLKLIQAWRQSRRSGVCGDWKLIVAGWGTDTMRERVLKAVQEANDSSITFVGPVFGEDKDALFGNASAYSLPSTSEGLPMAVLESLAHGTPVMITEFCNLPDVAPSGAGIQVGTDTDSIAEGIAQFIELSNEERDHMRLCAKALVASSYTWQVAAAQFEAVYEWLVSGGARPETVRWIH